MLLLSCCNCRVFHGTVLGYWEFIESFTILHLLVPYALHAVTETLLLFPLYNDVMLCFPYFKYSCLVRSLQWHWQHSTSTLVIFEAQLKLAFGIKACRNVIWIASLSRYRSHPQYLLVSSYFTKLSLQNWSADVLGVYATWGIFVALMLYYLVSNIYIYNGVWLKLPSWTKQVCLFSK